MVNHTVAGTILPTTSSCPDARESSLRAPEGDPSMQGLNRSQCSAPFDPRGAFCHDELGQGRRSTAFAMPLEDKDTVVVHVVDDDASMCKALEDLFETVGFATKTYGTARDFLKSRFIDALGCIVIDIRLPDMNGLEFQAQLAESGVPLPV